MSNEIIWAAVASVACGALIASLIGGAGTPWLFLGAVLAVGLVATTFKSRRHKRVLRSYYEPDGNDMPEARSPAKAATGRERADETGSRPARLLEQERATTRRAGARSQSLGSPQRRDPPE